ncbi:hypothetical protein TSUD_354160 [Trifolium subterraneum]|uniref:Ubiquitin-like domain-containing protein n=1 Tax=Trifolium subterraneum TaxID=3900 RepID=A0A2Z6M163_TRISU|nr:hypothetical protein TSUD_354160 [Trifolium subterraneum]
MEPTSHYITVSVNDSDGINKLYFRMKRNYEMKKMMNTYCDRSSLHFNSITFLFKGSRIWPDQTPYELDIEDGDEIEAVVYEHWRACINIDVKGQHLPILSITDLFVKECGGDH